MPPRRNTQHTEAASLPSLPANVLVVLAEHMVAQDILNNPVTAAQDIASMAQTCRWGACKEFKLSPLELQGSSVVINTVPLLLMPRALKELAKDTLWSALGAKYAAVQGARANDIAEVPRQQRWEAEHLPNIKLTKMERVPTVKQMLKSYTEARGHWRAEFDPS